MHLLSPTTRIAHSNAHIALRPVIEANPLAMWITDVETSRIVEANQSALQLYGYQREEFLGLCHSDLLPITELRGKVSAIREQAPQGARCCVHRKKDGTRIDVRLGSNDFCFSGGSYSLVIAEDTTEQRNTQARLIQMAHHDVLTGLPNRLLLAERISQALRNAKRQVHRVAIVCIDLDRFKKINDWYGHAVGDECLKQFGEVVTRRLRGMDTVARTGGEEFTLVLGEVESVASAALVGKALLQVFAKPFEIEGHQIRLSGSIGIAVYPDHGDVGDDLCKLADTAMYRAKRAGGGRIVMSGPDVSTLSEENESIEAYVRMMLKEDRCELHYQLQFCSDNQIRGAEALMRLPDGKGHYISLDRFIPQAEENGLIHAIGSWTMRKACQQLALWNEAGMKPIKVAINVSPLQLMQADFADQVVAALMEWKVDPSWLEMEITERVVLNFDEVGEKMRALHAIGIRFAVDDFGVGYSSLQHLHRLPISTVKIDRSFVHRLCDSSGTYPIVEAIISMGHSLNMEVLAEGVETEPERVLLEGMGCDGIQGYLLSRPLPAPAVSELLLAAANGAHLSVLVKCDGR